MARVVFLGTPEAAIPTLESLVEHHDVALVVTQPDRPRGRSRKPMPPPVGGCAASLGLEVAQPGSRVELEEAIGEHGPFDVGVVVAYGRILPPPVFDAPEHGMLNVHFSLLPRWRGAAPVARALMAGDPMTGVTIMKLDEGLDTGPIVTAQAIDIPDHLEAGELTATLAAMGAQLLVTTLPAYLRGDLEPVAQTDEGATYADKIEAGDRSIDPGGDPAAVVAQVRGLAPSPGATLEIDGEPHKILDARSSDEPVPPGTWAKRQGRPIVGLANGSIELIALQPPGKKPLQGVDWANGRQRDGGRVS